MSKSVSADLGGAQGVPRKRRKKKKDLVAGRVKKNHHIGWWRDEVAPHVNATRLLVILHTSDKIMNGYMVCTREGS